MLLPGRRVTFRPRLLRLPHVVEEFDHFLVNDEDDGHVQAHAAEPGNRAFVEPAGRKRPGLGNLLYQ